MNRPFIMVMDFVEDAIDLSYPHPKIQVLSEYICFWVKNLYLLI